MSDFKQQNTGKALKLSIHSPAHFGDIKGQMQAILPATAFVEGKTYSLVNIREHRYCGFIRLKETSNQIWSVPPYCSRKNSTIFMLFLTNIQTTFKDAKILKIPIQWSIPLLQFHWCWTHYISSGWVQTWRALLHNNFVTFASYHVFSPWHSAFTGAKTIADLSTFLQRLYFLTI